ncbi:putative protein N(5)-glutamine methyltransferase [Cellulomonas massiliensis]|uniref:putative protein N(5)-glutamine methyltransferase n=1 Tax=Cellulomonas massiliensis TaxID=1465811 RepID=UPI00031A95C4|nr:putative protein N(5)-glutamine methyltransferase [Cellulomonas massiliensis]
MDAAPAPTGPPDPLVARLRAVGSVFAEDEARVLRSSASSPAHLEAMTVRRLAGEPLEHVVGWVAFDGLRLAVGPGVFVPRRRTELLARRAGDLTRPGDVVVDLCCGAGAVGAVVQHRVPSAEVHAADVDPVAVACARRNLRPDRVHEGDLFAALPPDLRGRVAVLAVNAPYVPTTAIAMMPPEARDHEPLVALDGGSDGLDVHRRVAAAMAAWLAPGAAVLVETSEQQAPGTAALLAAEGCRTRVVQDEEVGATVVVGRLREPAGA